jgi:hypothetical protein
MLVKPARYSPATTPGIERQAPAKNRNTSATAGISSFSAAGYGLPQFCDSIFANAAPSASMRSASFSSSVARSFGGVRDQPSKAASAAHRRVNLGARGFGASVLPVAGTSTSSTGLRLRRVCRSGAWFAWIRLSGMLQDSAVRQWLDDCSSGRVR